MKKIFWHFVRNPLRIFKKKVTCIQDGFPVKAPSSKNQATTDSCFTFSLSLQHVTLFAVCDQVLHMWPKQATFYNPLVRLSNASMTGKNRARKFFLPVGVHANLIWIVEVISTPLTSTHHAHWEHKQKTSSFPFDSTCEWLCTAWFTSSSRGWSGGMQIIRLGKSSDAVCFSYSPFWLLTQHNISTVFPAGMWCLHPSNQCVEQAVSKMAGQCANV